MTDEEAKAIYGKGSEYLTATEPGTILVIPTDAVDSQTQLRISRNVKSLFKKPPHPELNFR
jgi:hypothetical protein